VSDAADITDAELLALAATAGLTESETQDWLSVAQRLRGIEVRQQAVKAEAACLNMNRPAPSSTATPAGRQKAQAWEKRRQAAMAEGTAVEREGRELGLRLLETTKRVKRLIAQRERTQ
jgi:hypothetical protein